MSRPAARRGLPHLARDHPVTPADLHHLGTLPPPDPEVPCCESAVYSAGERCTCWVAILRPDPHDVPQAGPHPARRTMCHDCAHRPGSPERTAEDGDLLDVHTDRPFFCHQGMPRAVGYTHPDLPGVCIRADAFDSMTGHYQPLIEHGRPYQADGQPGVLCAGWARRVGGLT